MRFAAEGVPQQEGDCGADYRQHESAELAVLIILLVVQIEQGGWMMETG